MFDKKYAIESMNERRKRMTILRDNIEASLMEPLPIGSEDELRMCFQRSDFKSEAALAEVLEDYSADEIAHFICQIIRGYVVK